MPLLLAQRKPNILLLLAGFFFLLGAVLLCFEPKKLSCIRVNGGQVDCLLTRSTAFGFVKAEEVSLSFFKEARVDTKIKRTLETDINNKSTFGQQYVFIEYC